MASSRGRLSELQSELLDAFFALERRFVLTGGGALAGFHLCHRESKDLDLFTSPPADLDAAQRSLRAAAAAIGAVAEPQETFPEFRRSLVRRADDATLVDLAVDRAPRIEDSVAVGSIRIDSPREIAANKICALLGRAEIRDLVDLEALLESGITLDQAIGDAARKDGGANAATLAWLLSELRIPADAVLPGSASPLALEKFRQDLVIRLRRLAFPG
jgi:hypothetical protein